LAVRKETKDKKNYYYVICDFPNIPNFRCECWCYESKVKFISARPLTDGVIELTHESLEKPGVLIITTDADYAWSVFAADVDGDGDLDVLSSSSNDDKIAWYENTYCDVDTEDLANFINQWLLSGDVEANFDYDSNPVPGNDVDLLDFSYLASYWLNSCPDEWPWP